MIQQWRIHVIVHLSKPIECTTPRVNPSISSRLWVIMMCQCRFIDYNKCATLVGNVDNGRGCVCVGVGHIWESLYFLLIFSVNPKLL